MWQEISKIGEKLVRYGLASAHFGNISIRKGKKILITARGSLLDELERNAIVEVDLNETPEKLASAPVNRASAETVVHQKIYQTLPVSAIIHTHSPFAIIQSMICEDNMLILEDCESKYFLKEIPIITGEPGTNELANKCAQALRKQGGNHLKAVVVQGHGTFVVGRNLTEAYLIVSSLEQACRIKYFTDLYEYFRKNSYRKKEKFRRTKK